MSFGLGSVALNLVREQRALGMDAKIWCLDEPSDIAWALDAVPLPRESIATFKSSGPRSFGYSRALERAAVHEVGSDVDVLHQHGIWTCVSRVSNLWRRRFQGPTIIAPHGSLEEWAVRRSRWKKTLAKAAYERENLREAACFHALAEPEADGLRRYGVRRPIAVIPNGVSAEWIDRAGSGSRFRVRYALPEGVRIMLYVGRITPVKNLAALVRAMARSRKLLRGWLLVVAGTDEFGYRRKLDQLIAELGIVDFVRFVGFVSGELKRDAYAAASVFVLPSLREASPVSVLEALGAGIPVLATQGTPWGELESHRCGWWPAVDVASITHSLRTVFGMPSDELAEFGSRGRDLVRESYTWAAAAAKCQELYGWLLGAADQPRNVYASGSAE